MASNTPAGCVDSWWEPEPTLCTPAVKEHEETTETTPEKDLARMPNPNADTSDKIISPKSPKENPPRLQKLVRPPTGIMSPHRLNSFLQAQDLSPLSKKCQTLIAPLTTPQTLIVSRVKQLGKHRMRIPTFMSSNTQSGQRSPLHLSLKESGEDYGLGADECEEKNIEKTLQELAQCAMAGVDRGGYLTYGYQHDDVDECQSRIYGNFNRTTIPHSEDRTEGAVPREFAGKPRVGHIRAQALADGASIPTKSETQRTGLTLATIDSVEIQPGQRVTLSTGLLLSSFDGRQARNDIDKIRVLSTFLKHADCGNEIKVVLVNFGCTLFSARSAIIIGSGRRELRVGRCPNGRLATRHLPGGDHFSEPRGSLYGARRSHSKC
jgi:hypothetical protein